MKGFLRRYRALTKKEFQQLRRNKKLVVQLTIPPTLMLVLWGFALNPEVRDMRTGIVDYDRTPASRELLTSVLELEAFELARTYLSEREMARGFDRREIDVAIVVPPSFAADLGVGESPQVQVIFDAVLANSAALAGGYLKQVFGVYNERLLRASMPAAPLAEVRTTALYNPGLVFSWFYVTAVMGVVLFVDGSLVAAAIAVREKELGTIEQLLMSPAQSLEILLAKTTPVLCLMVAGLMVSTFVAGIVFGLPMKGSLLLYFVFAVLAGASAMGLGILLATFSQNQQQAQLLTFFVNPFVMLCSGAFARIDNMPVILRAMSLADPLRYLVEVIRGITIRGEGIGELWQPFATLTAITIVLYGFSAWRYRRQLY